MTTPYVLVCRTDPMTGQTVHADGYSSEVRLARLTWSQLHALNLRTQRSSRTVRSNILLMAVLAFALMCAAGPLVAVAVATRLVLAIPLLVAGAVLAWQVLVITPRDRKFLRAVGYDTTTFVDHRWVAMRLGAYSPAEHAKLTRWVDSEGAVVGRVATVVRSTITNANMIGLVVFWLVVATGNTAPSIFTAFLGWFFASTAASLAATLTIDKIGSIRRACAAGPDPAFEGGQA